MEDRLGLFFQPPGRDRLGDSVRDCGHTEHPRSSAMRFRYFHRQHRRRKIAPRRHPIPDLIQVVLQIGLEIPDGTAVHARRPFVSLDLLPRLPYFLLRNSKRLAWRLQFTHTTPPGNSPG